MEFASDKLKFLKKCLNALSVTTYSELINLFVLEEFKSKAPFPIVKHIEERGEMELADAQALRLENWSRREGDLTPSVKTSSGDFKYKYFKDKPKGNGSTLSLLTCGYCKKSGHTIAFCKHPKSTSSRKSFKSAATGSASCLVSSQSSCLMPLFLMVK